MSLSTGTPLPRVESAPRLRAPQVVVSPSPPGATARRQRARRSLLWALGVVVAANLALAVTVETALPQLRDPEYGYRLARVREQVRAHPDRPLVVIVGTSRTQNAIDPDAMGLPDRPGSPLVFNFGISGAIPVRERLVLSRLLDDGVRPAAVVVELFPATLPIHGPADYLFLDSAAKLTAGDTRRLSPYLADPEALRRRWARERLNTWSSQQPVIASHLVPNWQPWRMRIDHEWESLTAAGFSPYCGGEVDSKRAERRALMHTEHSHFLRGKPVSELSDRCYRDLVADCRTRGIPVAFLTLPESPAVRAWYTPEAHAALWGYVHTLGAELGCPVFSTPANYTEDEFADGIHMLPSAARRLSRELAERHIKPWLEHQPK